MKKFIFLCIVFCTSCATSPDTVNANNAAALKSMMVGAWATNPDDPNNNFLDTRTAMTPMGDGEWVYLQLETGAERKLYRQRVLQLLDVKDGAVVQKTWSFAEPDQFADIASDLDRLNTLSLTDIKPSLEDGCDLNWQASDVDGDTLWRGYVDPDTCKIFSERRQAIIGIEGETLLQRDRLRQTERGFDSNGNKLFGTEPGEFIELYRVDTSSAR